MIQPPALPASLRLLLDQKTFLKRIQTHPSLLFSRHSDRPSLPPNTVGNDVSLTPTGVERARVLGRSLRDLQIRPGPVMICSPIKRNIETITEICTAAEWIDQFHKIEMDKRVLGPGTIYDDDVNVDAVVASYHGWGAGLGSYTIFNEIADGNQHRFFGVRSLKDGCDRILALIKEFLLRPHPEGRPPGGLSIVLSHDMHVAYALAKLFDVRKFSAETWPPFLDSLLFQLVKTEDGYKIVAVYGDRVIETDLL